MITNFLVAGIIKQASGADKVTIIIRNGRVAYEIDTDPNDYSLFVNGQLLG